MEHEKNTAVSTPEMVTISRAEYDSQQAKLAELAELKLQNQWLLVQLGLAAVWGILRAAPGGLDGPAVSHGK